MKVVFLNYHLVEELTLMIRFFRFWFKFYRILYRENRKYIEDQFEILDLSGNWVEESILNYLELKDFFKINGSGTSLSLGVIIKPIDQLNIGINFESKTKYSLSEEMFSELETSYFDYYFQPEDTILVPQNLVLLKIYLTINLLLHLKSVSDHPIF